MSAGFVRYGVVLGIFLGLAGCNPIRGELDVSQAMTLLVDETQDANMPCADADRPFDCEPTVIQKPTKLRPGRYAADLNFDSARQVELELVEPGFALRRIVFKVPPSVRLPKFNGHFAIAAGESGHSIGLSGDIDTTVAESKHQHGFEACYYTIERWGCGYHHRVGHGRKHRKKHRHGHCGFRHYRVQGSREVSFRNIFTTRAVELELVAPGSGDVMARFVGKQTDSDRRYSHVGPCY